HGSEKAGNHVAGYTRLHAHSEIVVTSLHVRVGMSFLNCAQPLQGRNHEQHVQNKPCNTQFRTYLCVRVVRRQPAIRTKHVVTDTDAKERMSCGDEQRSLQVVFARAHRASLILIKDSAKAIRNSSRSKQQQGTNKNGSSNYYQETMTGSEFPDHHTSRNKQPE